MMHARYNSGILAVLLLAGCSGSANDASQERLKAMAGGKLKEVTPVSGKVLVDGKPAPNVLIRLWSPHGDKYDTVNTVITGEEGTYCWTTYTECDGLELGNYKLTFVYLKKPRKVNSDDLFMGTYSDLATTKYELTVNKGSPQKDVDYELSMGTK